MEYNRLYTFGCSFTNWYWPTWADILLSEFPGENWGKAGGGNKFIFESLIECHVTNQITPDDLVIIMWSSFAREDRFINNWALCGNIYNARPLYDDAWLEKYWSDKGCLLHNLNFISAAIEVLKSINCKWVMCYAFDHKNLYDSKTTLIDSVQDRYLFDKYYRYLDTYESYFVKEPLNDPTRSGSFWKKTSWGENLSDAHPQTIDHYNWLNQNVLDKLQLSKETEENLKHFVKIQQEYWDMQEQIGIHPSITKKSSHTRKTPTRI